MTERRSTDRRRLIPRDGGRRQTDPQLHGTRSCYQRGCDCTRCKAAEATYRAHLRKQHAHGKTPLGAKVSAVDTWRRIRQLKAERFTKAEIARRLGLKRPILDLHTDVITVRNALKIRRLYRLAILLGHDGPADAHT